MYLKCSFKLKQIVTSQKFKLHKSLKIITPNNFILYKNSYKSLTFFSSGFLSPNIPNNAQKVNQLQNFQEKTNIYHHSVKKILDQYALEEPLIKRKMMNVCKKYINTRYLYIVIYKLFPNNDKILQEISQAKADEKNSKIKLFIGNLVAAYEFTNWLIKVIPINTDDGTTVREINYKFLQIIYSYFYFNDSEIQDFVYILLSNPFFLKEKNIVKRVEEKKKKLEQSLQYSDFGMREQINIQLINNYMTLFSNTLDAQYFVNSWNTIKNFETSTNSNKSLVVAYALLLDTYYIQLSQYYSYKKRDKLTKFSQQNKSVTFF